MAGFQNSSNKLYTDSSNNNTALTPASAHYSQTQQHPTTPTSPASFPNKNNSTSITTSTTTSSSKSESSRTNSIKNTSSTITTSTTTTNTKSNTSSSNPNSPAGPRSLTSTATQTSPPGASSQPHSAFSPYNHQQHPNPSPVTNSTKNSISESTMMTTSHLDNSGSTTLIYPPHTQHFANPTHPFWPNQWSFGGNGTAVLSTGGGSAFVPAVGYGAAASNLAQGHTPRPKLTTTIWEDEQTLCYQVDARGICVARRQDNDMINGTKLLNVVGMSRGKRDGILKNEKGRVVVKVGAMHLKGVWITFQRAKTLAAQFKISELLYPLFVEDPSIFLHNSYGPPMSTRIPSIGAGPGSQWRPAPHPSYNFSNGQYSPEATRQWYPYGSANPLLASPSAPQGQEHGSSPYPPNASYAERSVNVSTAPAVPIYSTHPPSRSHSHPQQHLEYDDTNSYNNLINGGQSQGQGVVVSGPAVSSCYLSPTSTPTTELKSSSTTGYYNVSQNMGYFSSHNRQELTPPPSTFDVPFINRNSQTNLYNTTTTIIPHLKTEDNNPSNGNGYNIRPGGLYNLVSAADVATQNGSTQIIGQKRGFEDESDDYNSPNNPNQSPPLTMQPPPPLNNIAVTTVNVAAGSFPSPMAHPSSPGGSAFSGYSKRVKYEQYPETATPSTPSASPSPSSSSRGSFQLPGLGAGPATPGVTSSTPGYTNSNLQIVTNAQSPGHHYSSSTNNNGGTATGTTTPSDNLDRYFDQSTVLNTPPDGPSEEPNGLGRRYDQYRQREEHPATEELSVGK